MEELFEYHKYRTLQFIFNEVALSIAKDELAKALKLLDLVEQLDPDNPIKLLKESSIYAIAGDKCKEEEILKK